MKVCPLPSARDASSLPHVLMSVLLAVTRGAEEAQCLLSEAEAGKTVSSVPQSTRKEQPERRSKTVIVFFSPGPTAEILAAGLPVSRGHRRGGGSRGRDEVCQLAPSFVALSGLFAKICVIKSTGLWALQWWLRISGCAPQRCL